MRTVCSGRAYTNLLNIQAMITGQILWAVAVFFIRASILCLYTRIFRKQSFRITCYTIHGVNLAFLVTVVLAALLICRPISAAWNPHEGTCGDQKALDLYIGIFNLLMDVCIVVLPMPVLWRLQMNNGKKLVLTGIFGIGVIVLVVTLARVCITSLINDQNAAQQYSLIALLTCLEALLGVISTCLPVMKPVFTKFGTSKVWSYVSATLTSGRRSIFSHSSTNHSGTHDKRRSGRNSGYHRSRGSEGGNEMRSWPVSPSSGSDPLAPIFVDSKVASLAFGHKRSPESPPRPPPKSPYYKPESPRLTESLKADGITVRRDWDVERGEEGSNVECDQRPWEDEKHSAGKF